MLDTENSLHFMLSNSYLWARSIKNVTPTDAVKKKEYISSNQKHQIRKQNYLQTYIEVPNS